MLTLFLSRGSAMIALLIPVLPQPEGFDLLRAWESRLPSAGAWSATFEVAEGSAPGLWVASFDSPSGAFALASSGAIVGRDLYGRRFAITPGSLGAPITRHSEIRSVADRPSRGDDEAVDRFFPTLILRDLIARPEHVRAIEQTPEGAVRIVAAWSGGSRDTSQTALREPPLPEMEVLYHFDLQGRMTRREHGPELGRTSWDYVYDDRSPSGFAVPSRITQVGRRGTMVQVLTKLEAITSERRHGAFDAVALRDTLVRESNPRQTVQLGPQVAALFANPQPAVANAQGAQTTSQPPRRTAGALDRYRWPLIGTGLVAIAAGAIALLRRARA